MTRSSRTGKSRLKDRRRTTARCDSLAANSMAEIARSHHQPVMPIHSAANDKKPRRSLSEA